MKVPRRSIPILPATPEISLDAAGLVALADLTTIQKRTALTGTSALLDIFLICPGIHMQQNSTSLNGGEYPACGALTTEYVFRVENPATVYYLQQVGETGHLTTLNVSKIETPPSTHFWSGFHLYSALNTPIVPALAYGTAVIWTIAVIILLGLSYDWWALGVVTLLVASRICNVTIIRRRADESDKWAGGEEPDVDGDLLILLSQDRWIRIKGKVDHLKAVTSGQWLRDQDKVENWITATATLIVYLAAALVSNATRFGQLLILTLLAGSAGLLAVTNSMTENLVMRSHILKVVEERKFYQTRSKLADALIEETGKEKWAIRMGMILDKRRPGETEQWQVIL